MKSVLSCILAGAIHAAAQSHEHVNFIRQQQQGSDAVWDMPVESEGTALSALSIDTGGSLFQLWSIRQDGAKEYLLDQKLVGAYLPSATVKVTTLDPHVPVARTRVGQPITVEINVSGLLSGADLPVAATSVLFEQHIASYADDTYTLDPTTVLSNAPSKSGYINANGSTFLKYETSSLTATDLTKASGEEHFVVHALSDGSISQTQLASDFVQIWPIASGAIKGISNGDKLRFQSPQVELLLNDLYPRSDTYLMLYKGQEIAGAEGEIITGFPMDRETSFSTVLRVANFDSHITEDGEYTMVLLSDTIYGREMLCDPVRFSINRTLHVNAMQTYISDK